MTMCFLHYVIAICLSKKYVAQENTASASPNISNVEREGFMGTDYVL